MVYLGRKSCYTEEPATGTVETVEGADVVRCTLQNQILILRQQNTILVLVLNTLCKLITHGKNDITYPP